MDRTVVLYNISKLTSIRIDFIHIDLEQSETCPADVDKFL